MVDGAPPAPPTGAMPPDSAQAQSTGSNPAAMPIANRGNQAAGLPKGQIAIKIAEAARLSFPPGSDIWRDFGKAIELMAKHIKPGEGSPGVMNTELQRLQQQQRTTAANSQLMRGMGGGQPPQPPQAA